MTSWTSWMNVKKKVVIGLIATTSLSTAYITYQYSGISTNKSVDNELSEVSENPSPKMDLRNIRRNAPLAIPLRETLSEKLPDLQRTISEEESNPSSPDETAANNRINSTSPDQNVKEEISKQDATSDLESKQLSNRAKLTNESGHALTEDIGSELAREISKVSTLELEALMNGTFTHNDYAVRVKAYNKTNLKPINIELGIFDSKRNKLIKTIKSDSIYGIKDPKNGDASIRIKSTTFGYKPMETTISLKSLDASGSEYITAKTESSVEVKFELERLRIGDIAVMWNVYFFRDASIMRPESKDELHELLDMLKENPSLRIMLHGHTNGGSHGKVIHLGPDDNQHFFDLDNEDHIVTAGSAKKLSLYRAETIQRYLIANEIDPSRIEIKGWGGKKMLYDKHDEQAKLNVRVEVEILSN